jgi:predicted N-acetyltransferase YhbS
MYRFKPAETEAEFEQIFRLNHSVFALELRQYESDPSMRRIDKFHDKNLYLIALHDERLVAMVALHDQPPFSVADRLADPTVLERFGRLMEVRLLAIDPEHRGGVLLAGLLRLMYEHVRSYEAVAISGHVNECAMYRKLGFRDLGPTVRSGEADYVPMILKVADLAERDAHWRARGF